MQVDLSFVKDSILQYLDQSKITAIIVLIIGSSVGFVLFWWASRKITSSVIKAFKGGYIEHGTIYKPKYKKKQKPIIDAWIDDVNDYEYGSARDNSGWGWF